MLENVARSGNELQFAFTNTPNIEFTGLITSNLAMALTNWTAMGNAAEISPGQYRHTTAPWPASGRHSFPLQLIGNCIFAGPLY